MKQHRTPRPTRILLALGLALLVAAGLTACQPGVLADCSKDCIDFVAANENADQLMLAAHGGEVTTEITVYSNSSRTIPVGYGQTWDFRQYPTMPITAAYQGLPVENPKKVQLKPATTYWYKAKAVGAGGSWRWETGSFETKDRIVTFHITSLWVYDDSDFTGNGELTFDARVNGGSSRQVYRNLNMASEAPAVNPDFTAKVSKAPNQVTLQVRGWDDDCTFSTCTAPAGAWDAVGGNGDTQWSTATVNVTVPPSGKDGTWEASTKAGGVGDIGFWVKGTWSVRYEYA